MMLINFQRENLCDCNLLSNRGSHLDGRIRVGEILGLGYATDPAEIVSLDWDI